MKLATAFQKTWHEVETTFNDQHIKNHEVFVFVFCKALSEKIKGIPAQYDGRRDTNSEYKPNFFIWQGTEDPSVVFIGKLRFEPAEPSFIRCDIKALMKFAHESAIDVLAPASSGKGNIVQKMVVSPDVETGYFIIGDFSRDAINQNINSCELSPDDKAKFHLAFGTVSDDQAQFQYHPPISGKPIL